MICEKTAERVIEAALSTGGSFAELFLEDCRRSNLLLVNGKVDKATSGIDYGAGIRIFYGNHAVYAYTNDLSEQNLINTAKEAALAVREKTNTVITRLKKQEHPLIHKIQILPDSISKRRKIDRLKEASAAAFSYNSLITQTKAGYLDSDQFVTIVNSEGLWAEDRRVRTRFTMEAVASNESEKQSGRFNPGAHMGYEFFDTINVSEIAKEASRIAVTMLKADICPSKKMMTVIDNGFGGVIFHEACGHGLEATAVARNASVFAGKLGQKIANEAVTAIDDGTIPNGWGSAHIDDEGMPCQKNILIENGILKSYMIDKLNGKKMGMAPTGSARRESYRFAPTSRMTNTYIAAGKYPSAEIIKSVDYGLYAKQMGGGSVEPSTGAFNFAVLEGYIIRNGKICEPVRGATLIGKGSEVLMNIDMVGSQVERAQGMCGSISGSIPVDVGQPMIRVSEITVGGSGN